MFTVGTLQDICGCTTFCCILKNYKCISVQFSSVQFSLFNSFKSITSPRDLLDIELVIVQYIQIVMHKDSIYKVTIIIQAGNKMPLIYGYLSD